MNEYNHQLTAFNTSINAFKAELKLRQTLVHVKYKVLFSTLNELLGKQPVPDFLYK